MSAASVVMSAPGRTPAAWSFCEEGRRRDGRGKEERRGRRGKEKGRGEGGGRRVREEGGGRRGEGGGRRVREEGGGRRGEGGEGEERRVREIVARLCHGFTIPPAYCCVTCPLEHWEQFTMTMPLLQAAWSSSRRLLRISGMLPAPNVCSTTPCIGG